MTTEHTTPPAGAPDPHADCTPAAMVQLLDSAFEFMAEMRVELRGELRNSARLAAWIASFYEGRRDGLREMWAEAARRKVVLSLAQHYRFDPATGTTPADRPFTASFEVTEAAAPEGPQQP